MHNINQILYILDAIWRKNSKKKRKILNRTEYIKKCILHGHWDKSSNSCLRPKNEDNECKGMTLNQFLHKYKNQKELTSSSSSIQQN